MFPTFDHIGIDYFLCLIKILFATLCYSEEVRGRKFSVVVAADLIHDFFLRKLVKALNKFEVRNIEDGKEGIDRARVGREGRREGSGGREWER